MQWNLRIGLLGGESSPDKKECETFYAVYQILSHAILFYLYKHRIEMNLSICSPRIYQESAVCQVLSKVLEGQKLIGYSSCSDVS